MLIHNQITLESGINIPLRLSIFGIFSRGYGLIMDLKDLHKFAHFKGLHLLFLSNFPEATFIQGATFIPDSRVQEPFSFSPRGFGETLSWGITKLLSFLLGTYK